MKWLHPYCDFTHCWNRRCEWDKTEESFIVSEWSQTRKVANNEQQKLFCFASVHSSSKRCIINYWLLNCLRYMHIYFLQHHSLRLLANLSMKMLQTFKWHCINLHQQCDWDVASNYYLYSCRDKHNFSLEGFFSWWYCLPFLWFFVVSISLFSKFNK